jgi:hypothetical protein
MDSDGVFAHFDQNVFNRFGVYPSGMNDDEMWRRINAEPDFWPEMPLMPGAERLWDAIKHVEPTVLTGCPKSDYERAVEHKMSWWANGHFAHEKVITCLSKDKALHMKQPGDWLVDDMSKNCKRWEKAGGRAYRYDGDVDKCVAFLKAHDVI